MPNIRPVSDLRNKFADISREVHAADDPVFLTKNGYGDMVVMSMEAYERLMFNYEISAKLQAAENEAKNTNVRISHQDVLAKMKKNIQEGVHRVQD